MSTTGGRRALKLLREINAAADRVHQRAPRMVLRRTGLGRHLTGTEDAAVTAWRPDGWPLCPWCGEDELAAIRAWKRGAVAPHEVDLCYRCGPVEVVTFEAPDVSAR